MCSSSTHRVIDWLGRRATTISAKCRNPKTRSATAGERPTMPGSVLAAHRQHDVGGVENSAIKLLARTRSNAVGPLPQCFENERVGRLAGFEEARRACDDVDQTATRLLRPAKSPAPSASGTCWQCRRNEPAREARDSLHCGRQSTVPGQPFPGRARDRSAVSASPFAAAEYANSVFEWWVGGEHATEATESAAEIRLRPARLAG